MGARTRGFANNVLTAGKIDTSDGLTGSISNSNINNTSVSGVTSLPPSVGSGIASVSSNPAAPAATGIIWYNTTDERFKIAANLEAWHSGASLLKVRAAGMAFGTQTASGYGGGYDTAVRTFTEEYDGTGWTASGAMSTARYQAAGCGTQTAGLVFAGAAPGQSTATEEYNGTSWTNGGAISTGRHLHGGAGVQDAAIAFGGNAEPPAPAFNGTEEYDGSSWTAGGNLNTGRQGVGGFGTLTAGVASGGYTSTAVGNTEHYDGTSWTNSNAMATTVRMHGTAGIQTAGLAFGGYQQSPSTTRVTTTQKYDGTTWTNSPATVATARTFEGAGNGSQSAALATSAYPTTSTSNTEEFNISSIAVTAGTWASGANYPITVQDASGVGPVTANATFGGYDGPSYTNATNEYDGSSWTSGGNMNTARATYQTGIGSQTAAIGVSGYIPGGGPTGSTNTESYNGTSWTNVNSLSTSRYNASATGIQTSGIITGGNTPSVTNATEEWDGTNWTAGGNTPVVSAGKGMFGQSSTDALLCGANNPPAGTYITLSYDGTSWSDTGHNLLDRKDTLAGGSQQGATNLGIIAGGFDSTPAIVASSYQYNGSSWVTGPSISTSRRGGAAAGTYASCMAVGGEQPSQSNHTEEFTSETTALNAENITDS